MFTYIVLNTMIWAVVHFTSGRVTPTDYHMKEVYNWGMGKRDMPTWMLKLEQLLSRHRSTSDSHKDVVELVDTGSTIRNSSHNSSATDKRDTMPPSLPQDQTPPQQLGV